ncbi:hypothetical protein MtrunA17_Chr1g0201821 [Medicago truncatula]|uniref:Uncharacterized protein n=1 Tax=Medicago truncatula TaxID=3880 RepID=A0A396JTN7_MEDTR|nr:hypothetical protein MtrunA17_Chr1g0201821 [Medicago truncatula]
MVKLDHAVLLGNYRKRSGVVGFLLETIMGPTLKISVSEMYGRIVKQSLAKNK